jgi:hypothetical protein
MILAVGVLSHSASDVAADKHTAGYYRVAKIDDVWWFIRPDGKPFFSSGVNVVDPGPTREGYDSARPEYAAFRHYPDITSWASTAHERLRQWGFNTVGGWSAPEMTKGPLPYIEVLHVGGKLGAPFSDLLHPQYAARLDEWVREYVKPRATDANLLGWCSDNEQSWFADMLFWRHIRQSPESKTRQALVRLLKEHYQNDFGLLKTDFRSTGAQNFTELERGGELRFRPGRQGMKVAEKFMGLLAEHYYRTMHEAIRRYDPNHLILGDRYHGFCPDVVVEAARPYVDVLTTNYDRPGWTNGLLPSYYLERLHVLSDKPILVTEYYVAARENRSRNGNSSNLFTIVATQQDRAAALRNRLAWLASLPYVVGAHWFQYSDEPTHGRVKDGEDYNFGLVDIEDQPYEELCTAFTDVHDDIHQLHSSANKAAAPADADAVDAGPMPIPMATSAALEGIGHWDTERALVRGGRKWPRHADLLVCWDNGSLYLAVVCCNFVESNAYSDEDLPPEASRLEWQLYVDGDSPKLRVGFGIGAEYTVSDRACPCRLWQHGARYTVMARLPAATIGRDQLQRGNRLTLKAVLIDRQLNKTMSWERELRCDASDRKEARLPRVIDLERHVGPSGSASAVVMGAPREVASASQNARIEMATR